VAQAIDERHARLDLDRDVLSIHFETYRHWAPDSVNVAQRFTSLSPLAGRGSG
jgi:hypothetical protein